MALFKYGTSGEAIGTPTDAAPHAIYMPHTGGPVAADTGDAMGRHVSADVVAPSVLLNDGPCVRSSHDARGWKWRDAVRLQRDGSLLFAPNHQIVRLKPEV